MFSSGEIDKSADYSVFSFDDLSEVGHKENEILEELEVLRHKNQELQEDIERLQKEKKLYDQEFDKQENIISNLEKNNEELIVNLEELSNEKDEQDKEIIFFSDTLEDLSREKEALVIEHKALLEEYRRLEEENKLLSTKEMFNQDTQTREDRAFVIIASIVDVSVVPEKREEYFSSPTKTDRERGRDNGNSFEEELSSIEQSPIGIDVENFHNNDELNIPESPGVKDREFFSPLSPAVQAEEIVDKKTIEMAIQTEEITEIKKIQSEKTESQLPKKSKFILILDFFKKKKFFVLNFFAGAILGGFLTYLIIRK